MRGRCWLGLYYVRTVQSWSHRTFPFFDTAYYEEEEEEEEEHGENLPLCPALFYLSPSPRSARRRRRRRKGGQHDRSERKECAEPSSSSSFSTYVFPLGPLIRLVALRGEKKTTITFSADGRIIILTLGDQLGRAA